MAPALAAQTPAPSTEPVKLETVRAEMAATQVPRFFNARQFATLEKLCAVVMPALNGNPGAAEAGAALFLDFLLGASPAERQQLYRQGLDHLEAESRRLFKTAFAGASDVQIAQLLKPLLVAWTFDPPTNPLQRFLAAARADIRQATVNSPEWAQAQASTGSRRRRGGAGGGFYWYPIDPVRR